MNSPVTPYEVELRSIFTAIQEYQMNNVELAKTTEPYKLSKRGIEVLDQSTPPSASDELAEALYSKRDIIVLLNEVLNKVKTYKVGNSGSWYDAAVDRDPIIDIMKRYL